VRFQRRPPHEPLSASESTSVFSAEQFGL